MVSIYSQGDKGFPAIASVTDIFTVIKATLITGYGTRQSAGWSLIYDNLNDLSAQNRRLVVRSLSPASEQAFYEFELVSGVITIRAYHSYIDGVGIDKWSEGCINTSRLESDGWNVAIFADEKCCYVWVSSIIHFFGTYEPMDTAYSSSLTVMATASNILSENAVLPSTLKPRGLTITNSDGTKMLCRSYYAQEEVGFGSRVIYDPVKKEHIVAGGLINTDNPVVYKVELISKQSNRPVGYLPYFYYADCAINQRFLYNQKIRQHGSYLTNSGLVTLYSVDLAFTAGLYIGAIS